MLTAIAVIVMMTSGGCGSAGERNTNTTDSVAVPTSSPANARPGQSLNPSADQANGDSRITVFHDSTGKDSGVRHR